MCPLQKDLCDPYPGPGTAPPILQLACLYFWSIIVSLGASVAEQWVNPQPAILQHLGSEPADEDISFCLSLSLSLCLLSKLGLNLSFKKEKHVQLLGH